MTDKPKHIAALGRDFTLHLMQMGYSESDVLDGINVTLEGMSEDEAKVPVEDLAAIFNRGVELTGDDLVGLHWGQARRFVRMGLIGYLGRSSPNVAKFMLNLERYQRVFSEPMIVDQSKLLSDGIFSWTYDLPVSIDLAQLVEAQTCQFVFGLNRLVPRPITPVSVNFEHRRSTNIKEIEKIFGCPVNYGLPRNHVIYHRRDLELEIMTSDDRLNKILLRHCDMVLAQTPKSAPDIQIKVERMIADHLTSGRANLDDIARDLGMSARTLARRLNDAGTSFQTLLGNIRRALAERYLKDKSMSQSEIAFLLGYSDVSSFAAAFKRWTGYAPGEIRHKSA